MSRITKPCPECGGTDYARETPASICGACKSLIAFAKQRQAEDSRMSVDGEEVVIFTRERGYALPGYYPKVGDSAPHQVHDRFKDALLATIMTMARPTGPDRRADSRDAMQVPKIPEDTYGGNYSEWGTQLIMRKDQALAMVELELAMRAMIEAVGEASYDKGQNLLMSIASGKLSMEKLNEAHTKQANRQANS